MTDHAALAEGLQQLEARARAAVVLRYYLDLDYARIGAILGTSESNVGSILSRALDRLQVVMAPAPIPAAAHAARASLAKEAGRHG